MTTIKGVGRHSVKDRAGPGRYSIRAAVMMVVFALMCGADGGKSATAPWPRTPDDWMLPAWFENHRVQAHSESSLEIALELTPEGFSKAIRSLGASVLTRMFLSIGEPAWWPSRVGAVNPLIGDRDFAAELIRAGHAEGLKLVGYYRHMCDQAMQAEHPDWICRQPDGRPVLEVRGKRKDLYVLCMNSPYRDYTRTRLLELADRGLDAIYFDSWHMPDICACGYCREAFRRETGREMEPGARVGSAGYFEAVDFVNRTMVRTFREWREAVRAEHPGVFFAIGSSRYPMFFSPHMDEALMAISDTSKTEFHKPFGGDGRMLPKGADFAGPAFDDQLAVGWSLVRDASGGRPPLMWIPYLASEKTALYSAAAAVSYGCIASVRVPIRELERDMPGNREKFPEVFAMGDKVSPYLAYARAMGLAAVHVSERARNGRLGDFGRMWNEVFGPVLGACRSLRECHVPWVTLGDAALAAGPTKETKVLILPWPTELTAEQQAAVRVYEQAGGAVIRMKADAGWATKRALPGLVDSLKDRLRGLVADGPIRITGPDRMHAMVYHQPKGKGLTICLANTWAWFRSYRDPEPDFVEQPEPAACDGVVIDVSWPSEERPAVVEAVTGQRLRCERVGKMWRIRVPRFQILACVSVCD